MLISSRTAMCQGEFVQLKRAKKAADLFFSSAAYAFGAVHYALQDHYKSLQSQCVSGASAALKQLCRKMCVDRHRRHRLGVAGLNYRHDSGRLSAKADGSKFLCKPPSNRRSSVIDAQGFPPFKASARHRRKAMSRSAFSRFGLGALVVTFACPSLVWGGMANPNYKVLNPISHGNLTIFPVVTSITHDTSGFLTLDEGIRSGEVVVTEAGRTGGLIRGPQRPMPVGGAQVNSLVLVNNSKRPLILLAGEIVTGGKQDRVVAKDRVIAAESDPVDLGVFCVEPGRWTDTSTQFSTMKSYMAQPSVRSKAMVAKDQRQVWQSVGEANGAIVGALQAGPVSGPAPVAQDSYAKTFDEETVRKAIADQAAPVEQSYSSSIRQLRDQHAVGGVVAVGGRLIWADLFASSALLEKYWPKLVRTYAADAITTHNPPW